MRRILTLTDEQIELLLAWAEVAKAAASSTSVLDVPVHDWDEDDDALQGVVSAARLKP